MPIQSRRPAENKYAKVLIHSPAGHGKTRFLGTAQEDPRTYPMAFLNFESGDVSLAGLDIDVYDMRDFTDYNEAKKMLQHPKCPYKSAGIDSVTETQVAGITKIIEDGRGKGAEPEQLGQPGWGLILAQMRHFVRDFKFLKMHTFFTALSKDDVVARVGQVKVPAVQGAFAAELPGIVDVVAYLALEDTEQGPQRLLLLHSYPRFSVKCRTPWNQVVPSEIEDPTITKLLDTIGYK